MCPDLPSVPNSWAPGRQLEQYKLTYSCFVDVILLKISFCTEILSWNWLITHQGPRRPVLMLFAFSDDDKMRLSVDPTYYAEGSFADRGQRQRKSELTLRKNESGD